MRKSLIRTVVLSFFGLSVFLFFSSYVFQSAFAKSYDHLPPNISEYPETDRIIVQWRAWTPGFVRQNILNKHSTRKIENLQLPDTDVIQVPENSNSVTSELLNSKFWVNYAEPDFIAQKLSVPNDTSVSDQWGLPAIDAFNAWDTEDGSSSVDIAIIDTGIKRNHPDLQTKISQRANFTWVGDDDGDGHGTHVAGIAGAATDNGAGVAGVCPQCRLMSVKVLDNQGFGFYSWVANGIYWAADNGAEIINLSLGGSSPSITLQNAIEYAAGRGVVIIGAAGNSGNTTPIYPANYPQVISVTAVDQSDAKPDWANLGAWIDLAAPGQDILSTYKNTYAYISGTSMATPHVAGVAGLIKSLHPGWSSNQIRDKLQSSADNIPQTGNYWVYGRLNACEAVGGVGCVGQVGNPTPTDNPTPTLEPTSTPTLEPSPTPTPIPPTFTPTPIPPTATPTQEAPTATPTTPLPPTSTPTPSPQPTDTPSPTPTPTPNNLPWWCAYVPDHWTCQ